MNCWKNPNRCDGKRALHIRFDLGASPAGIAPAGRLGGLAAGADVAGKMLFSQLCSLKETRTAKQGPWIVFRHLGFRFQITSAYFENFYDVQ
jgi:hypothetical protein